MKELLLTSSVLILALAALRFLFRNSISRRLQYGLWLLVVLRLVLPVTLLPASFSVLSGAEALSQRWETPAQTAAVSEPESPETSNPRFEPVELPAVSQTPQPDIPAEPDVPVVTDAASQPEPALPWRQIAYGVWAAGTIAAVLWLVAVNLRFRRQLRTTRRAVPVEGSPLPVYVTDAIVSPCLFGLFRPAVYLTPRALQSEEYLRHVLTHELCHYRHGDHVWALVRSALLALYWFDPLVWLAAVLSRADSELACDEAAIQALGTEQRLAYGRTLVDMVAVRRPSAGILSTATTMTSGKRSLKVRLGRIVKKPKVALPAVVAVVVLAAVCVACTFTGADTVNPDTETVPADAADTATSQVTSTLSQVRNGVETPIEDPDSFLANEIYFDVMVKSSAAPAVPVPDTYYLLTATETPTEGGEPISVREHPIFRLEDGTPVMQHGEQYTALHPELMSRLEAAANRLPSLPVSNPDPKASAHQDVLIDYADDDMVIFHGFFGLFVYDRTADAVTRTLALDTAIGTSQVYTSSERYAEVAVSRDGRVIRVAARSGAAIPETALWIDTASWTGGMGPWSELREPFNGGTETVTTEHAETVSIEIGSGLIGELQLVTGDGAHILFTEVQPTPTGLDEAIQAAVANWCGDKVEPDDYLTEAHWLLGTETAADSTVTAYAYVVYQTFSGDHTAMEQSGIGGELPMVFTFQRDENAVLQLTELWEPEEGKGWDPSIQQRFPASLSSAAMAFAAIPQGDHYVLSLYQSCYAQAMAHFHLNSGPGIQLVLEDLMGQLEQTLDQGQPLNVNDTVYRTLCWYGDDTLHYSISQLLDGSITDNRRIILEALLQSIHPGDVEGLTSPDLIGEPTFEDMKEYAAAMAEEFGVEYFAGNRTAEILLWSLDYQIPALMTQYQEVDRLVETICSTPPEADSTVAYFSAHPVETGMLLSFDAQTNNATLRYCIYAFLRNDSEGLRGAVLCSLLDNLLGGEAIAYDAADAQDYFDHWQETVLQLYAANGEAYVQENLPIGTVLLECMGLLEPAE